VRRSSSSEWTLSGTRRLSQNNFHQGDPREVGHAEQHTLPGIHGSYALPRRRGRISQDKVGMSPPEHEDFRAILGSMDFPCMCTRPDMAFAVSVINKRQTNPSHVHMKQLKPMLLYLNRTRPMGITYGRLSQDIADDIKLFSDSSWVADTTTGRSQSREVVILNGGAVNWTS
jgi:hypothetical protein